MAQESKFDEKKHRAFLDKFNSFCEQAVTRTYIWLYQKMLVATSGFCPMITVVTGGGFLLRKLLTCYINDCWVSYHDPAHKDPFVTASIDDIKSCGIITQNLCIFSTIASECHEMLIQFIRVCKKQKALSAIFSKVEGDLEAMHALIAGMMHVLFEARSDHLLAVAEEVGCDKGCKPYAYKAGEYLCDFLNLPN